MKAANSILFCLAFAASAHLLAQEATPSPDAPDAVHTVYLEYHEADQGLISWPLVLPQDALVREEAYFGRWVWRGRLRLGSKPEDAVPFAWEPGQGKLHLDLNRNGHLTDDPNGVFSTGPLTVQTFTNIHLEFKTAMGVRPLLVDLSFYENGKTPAVFLACHSFWAAKVTLQGREWQLGLIENSRLGSTEGGYLLLRPWESRNQPFNLQDGSLDGFGFCRDLFFGQRAYRVDWAYVQQDGAPKFKLELKGRSTALGELRLTGKFIERLILTGTPDLPAAGPFTVVLDRPEPMVKIPLGGYSRYQIQLEAGGARAWPLVHSGAAMLIGSGKTAVLTAGGPLINTVEVAPQGGSLSLNYVLVGAEGAAYQLRRQEGSQPPGWVVYRKGKAMAAGRFQFG
jgi:hypothetical protein